MRRTLSFIGITIVAAATATAQPVVNSVVNSASYASSSLPNGGIAEGSIFVVFGTNMGPSAIAQSGAFPLPTLLGGTSIKISVNGTSTDAAMIYSLATQVAAILPSNTPVGAGTLTVSYNGQTSAAAPINVVQSNLGIYTLNQAGSGPGVITFASYQPVTSSNSAHAGDVLVLWGTGLGPISGNDAAGPAPGDLTSIPVSLYVGVTPATLTYRGRSGCCAGLDQIVFTVPSGIEGCSVPVSVQIGDVVSNFSSIAIAPTGTNTCSDPLLPISSSDLQNLLTKGTVASGVVTLDRISEKISIGGIASSTTTDTGSGSFSRVTFTPGGLPPEFVSPVTYGSCYVYTYSSASSAQYTGSYASTSLDAGSSLTVTGPNGVKTLTKESVTQGSTAFISYEATLGNGTPGNYLDPGSYTVSGPGGADVGPFSVTFNVPQPITWTNQSSVSTIVRSAGQLITWTGGNTDDMVYITGGNTAVLADESIAGAAFTCLAHAGDQSFTIPSSVLLALPPSSSSGGFAAPGILEVFSGSAPQTFSATGLDIGYANVGSGSGSSVTYQ